MMNAMKVGAAVEAVEAPPPPPDEAQDQLHSSEDQQSDEAGSTKQQKKDLDPDDEEKQKQHEDYYDAEFHYSSKLIRSSRRSIATQRAYCWIRVLMLLATVIVIAVVVPLTISSRREDEDTTSSLVKGSYDPSATSEDETSIVSGGEEKDKEDEIVDGGVTSGTIANSVDLSPPVIDHTPVSAFCPTSGTPLDMTFAFEQAVSGIVALHGDLSDLPAHLLDDFENLNDFNVPLQEGDFNASWYFQILQDLSLPEGKVLEYFYILDGMGGFPVLYVRDINNEKPFLTLQDFQDYDCEDDYPCLGGEGADNYIDQMVLNGTPESYVDLITLKILGGQFYLFWHSNFYDDKIIYKNDLVQSVESLAGMCACSPENGGQEYSGCLSSEDLETLRATVDLTPTLECDDDEVRVSVVVYSNWRGFSRRFYIIDRHDGRLVPDAYESEEILKFQCGIIY